MGRRKKNENTETSKELAVVNAEVGEVQEVTETTEATETEFTEAREVKQEKEPSSLELGIEAELFSGMRAAFNSTMQEVLEKMTSRELTEGEVNLKLSIALENQNVLGHNAIIPSFKHVVTGNYKEKIECKGSFGIPQTYLHKKDNGEYELRALEDNLFNEPTEAETREAEA